MVARPKIMEGVFLRWVGKGWVLVSAASRESIEAGARYDRFAFEFAYLTLIIFLGVFSTRTM